jgi:pimeloyl-ACP methyl ester carboxylesterase
MRVNGVDLHVEPPAGEGALVVLVHGGWTESSTWAGMVPALARSFRVVSYDRRGHSRSGRTPEPSPRRQDEDDLAALIEALGAPAHVVGNSYGAAIALSLAGRRPDLVRSVVAHEPVLIGLVPMPEVAAAIHSVQAQIAAGDVEAGTRRFFEEVIGVAMPPGATTNAQTFVDMGEDPEWASLDVRAVRRYPGPILITHGDASPLWLPHVALEVATWLGRESQVIAGAGHSPQRTNPHAFASVIEDFIGRTALLRAA